MLPSNENLVTSFTQLGHNSVTSRLHLGYADCGASCNQFICLRGFSIKALGGTRKGTCCNLIYRLNKLNYLINLKYLNNLTLIIYACPYHSITRVKTDQLITGQNNYYYCTGNLVNRNKKSFFIHAIEQQLYTDKQSLRNARQEMLTSGRPILQWLRMQPRRSQSHRIK